MSREREHAHPVFGQVYRLVAVEPDPSMRALARGRVMACPVPVTLLSADAHALPLADNSFDAVLCACVLCSVARPPRVLRSCGGSWSPAVGCSCSSTSPPPQRTCPAQRSWSGGAVHMTGRGVRLLLRRVEALGGRVAVGGADALLRYGETASTIRIAGACTRVEVDGACRAR